MYSKEAIAKLTPHGTLRKHTTSLTSFDEFEPPCHLCDKYMVSGESYVYVKFNSDRTRDAVCLACAKPQCQRQAAVRSRWTTGGGGQ